MESPFMTQVAEDRGWLVTGAIDRQWAKREAHLCKAECSYHSWNVAFQYGHCGHFHSLAVWLIVATFTLQQRRKCADLSSLCFQTQSAFKPQPYEDEGALRPGILCFENKSAEFCQHKVKTCVQSENTKTKRSKGWWNMIWSVFLLFFWEYSQTDIVPLAYLLDLRASTNTTLQPKY